MTQTRIILHDSYVWTPEELRRQKILDDRARATGADADANLAALHFNRICRKYDRITADAAFNMLAQAAVDALAAHRSFGCRELPYVPRGVSEAESTSVGGGPQMPASS